MTVLVAVMVAVMAPSAIHVSASFAQPRRRLRERGIRIRCQVVPPSLHADVSLSSF